MNPKLFGFLEFQLTDLVDISIVAVVFYYLFLLFKGTRAVQMFFGFAIVFVLFILSQWWDLKGVSWIFSNLLTVGLVSLVIVFQPEMRGALTRIGQSASHTSFRNFFFHADRQEETISEIVDAAKEMSENNYGAIMVLERRIGLKNYIDTGEEINGLVSARLLRTLFWPSTPLHDGAVIIQGNRIAAAGCILPVLSVVEESVNYGMRHRAARAIAMETDAVVVVVSEENGALSIAHGTTFTRGLSSRDLEKKVNELMAYQS
jgi:diadenylate cyclase